MTGEYGSQSYSKDFKDDLTLIFDFPSIGVRKCNILGVLFIQVFLQPSRLPFGSRIIYDIMTQVFLGDSNRSIAHHWWGLSLPQPIIPIYTVALAATYVSAASCFCILANYSSTPQAVFCIDKLFDSCIQFTSSCYKGVYDRALERFTEIQQNPAMWKAYLEDIENLWLLLM